MAEVDAEQEEERVYDWSAYYDDSGQVYYYNSVTEESSWEAPENYNPLPAAPEDSNGGGHDDPEGDQRQDASDHVPGGSSGWVAYRDDEGRVYYYNQETGETQWEKPESYVEGEPTSEQAEEGGEDQQGRSDYDYDQSQQQQTEHENADAVSPSRQGTPPSSSPIMDDEGNMAETAADATPERVPTPEPEIDPAVKLLQDAETDLNLPDSILEMKCVSNVQTLLQGLGAAEGGQKALQAMITNFQGQTAVCGLLGQWLADLRTMNAVKTSGDRTDAHQVDTARNQLSITANAKATDEIRNTIQQVINKIAKERFTKEVGDEIFKLKKAEAVFLDEMMDSERWRKLLIDLSATNKDSTLLKFCLKSISNRGYHREIIQRINPSDHFAVFNAMLASEFAGVAIIGLNDLVGDLRRTCTSTSYTYLYAMEVLRYLGESFRGQDLSEDRQKQQAQRKWRRLKEDLENAMMDPSMSSSTAGSTSTFRKRRLDVALTASDLQQRQRRRLMPGSEQPAMNGSVQRKRESDLHMALLSLLRKYSMGSPLDDHTLELLFPNDAQGTSAAVVGKLLISYPLSIKALMGYLFRPGTGRVSSLLTRNKCAHLLAVGVISAEDEARRELGIESPKPSVDGDGENGVEVSQEEKLKGMILTGSQLCELVENMVSFTVSADASESDRSAGMKLCRLALHSCPVAQGVILWAYEITTAAEFVTSPSYPTISPSILSLVRIVAVKYPFIRPTAIDMALSFLGHSNSEILSQKMNDLKEQALRLLLHLMVHGEACSVLRKLASLLKRGTTTIDTSLIRYFLGIMLDVLQPPYSTSLAESLGCLLLVPMCVEALRSTFFGDVNKSRLQEVIRRLPKEGKKKSEVLTLLEQAYT